MPRWEGLALHKILGHRFPPNAMLVLAALVSRHGWDVRIIDENYDEIPNLIKPNERPDLVGITVWTTMAPRAYRIAEHYRSHGVPAVLGGVHPSLLPGEALRYCDAIVAGEAESVIGDVLADADAGSLRRVYYGDWVELDDPPTFAELAPFLRGFPAGRYRPTHSLQSARGCRYNCDYCSVIRINGRGQRHVDPAWVVDQIRRRSKMFPRTPWFTVFFTDDDIASDPETTKTLLEEIVRSGIKVYWAAQSSIGLASDPEFLDLAARSGAKMLFVGLESVSREALKQANKKNRPHLYKELVGRMHQRGISVEAGFIFGFDTDGPSVFEETVKGAEEIGVDSAHFTALTPIPGTQTFARLYERGVIEDFDWRKYSSYRAVFQPAKMSREELDRGLRAAYRAYYAKAARSQRLRSRMFGRSPAISAFYAGVGRSYAKHYAAIPDPTFEVGFEPNPVDLEQLLITSKADANDAIKTALRQIGALPERQSVPVEIGTRSG